MQAIETTFYSHSTSYYSTMCAIRSKPYGWDLRKKAKISSKNKKKTFLDFLYFLKNCAGDSNYFLQSLYIILGLHVCRYVNPYGWDLRKTPKVVKKHKKTIFGLFIFSPKLCRRLKRLFTVILHHIMAPYVQIDQNRMAGI